METVELDRQLPIRQLEAKHAALERPRQRRMLETYIEHMRGEVAGDVDQVMATVAPVPDYHIWVGGKDVGPKGFDAVRTMYEQMYTSHSNYFEIDFVRVVVDDEHLVAEIAQRKIVPGKSLLSGPWTDNQQGGDGIDRTAHYLSTSRAILVVPFDDDCRVIGEDAYGGGMTTRALADEELPNDYRAFIAT